MRYTQEHKTKTRERIIAAAERAFRLQGYVGAGLDGIMQAVGLTHGGFYGHFRSKDALLAASLASGLRQTSERLLSGLEHLEGAPWLRALVGRYLSMAHRNGADDGCMMPPLISELSRAPQLSRAAFEQQLQLFVAHIATKTPAAPNLSADERALATVALCVGGLALSRAVSDPAYAERILEVCQRLAVPEQMQTKDRE